MAELDIGKHCSVLSCNLLDYLPLKCNKCGFHFCKEHHFYEYHNCNKFESRERSVSTNQKLVHHKCSYVQCQKTELVDVKCPECKDNFCLQHRLQEDHQCIELSKSHRDKMTNASKLVINSLVSKDIVIGPTKILSEKSKVTAAKVNFMKMKMKAVGDKGLPMEQRFYFQVKCPVNDSSEYVFYDIQWTVGRTIDALAKMLRLQNKNNVQDAPKLVLGCSGSDASYLDTSMRWAELLDGQELFNGSVLYLKVTML